MHTCLGLNTPVTFTDGNGVELSYLGSATSSGTGAGDQYAGLDRFGRIVDQKWINTSGTIDEFQYSYDQDSNVATKNDMVLSGDNESFTYDGLNRLTAYTQGSNSESWSLDALGNWNSHSVNGATTSRTTSAQNQVKTVGSATLGYDKNGNTLTDDSGQQYVYDGWNRLVTVKNSGGTTIASYTYDPEGRRITQTEAGTTTDLYYSDRWQVIEEHVADNTTVQFTWGVFYVNQLIASDAVITEIDDGHGEDFGGTRILVGGRNYAEQDADWDVTSMTDDGGSVLERYQYDPTGNVVVLNATGTTLGAGMNSSTIGQVIGYQGGWTDSSTGLVTFQYRDLNTGLGRWIEQDPAGYVNGPNRYQFCLSSPINRMDPSGESTLGFGNLLQGTGLSPVNLRFGAFIPKILGSPILGNPTPGIWYGPEPLNGFGPTTTDDIGNGMFGTDDRNLAGQNGTSRLITKIQVIPIMIGHLNINNLNITSTAGPSHRLEVVSTQNFAGVWTDTYLQKTLRQRTTTVHMTVISVTNTTTNLYRRTIIRVKTSGNYPFNPFSPNIEYDTTYTLTAGANGVLSVALSGNSAEFPAYEGLVNGQVQYAAYPSDPGPSLSNLGNLDRMFVGTTVVVP